MANDPASKKRLGDKSGIRQTASVRDTSFGRWCEVGARAKVAESRFSDDSDVTNDSDILHAAIGAGMVVAKDVPPFAVMVGKPGRVIRQQFPREVTEALQWIAWWDWPRQRVGTALQDVRRLGAAAFCAKYDHRAQSKPDAQTPPGTPYPS